MRDFETRLKELEAKVNNMVRTGKVSVIDEAGVRVRVTFPDRENVQTDWLKVMVENTQKNKDYWMPEVGEDVLCIFLPNGLESGFVLGGYYVDGVAPPAASADVRVTKFADGGRFEYNRATGEALVIAQSELKVVTPKAIFTQEVEVRGLLTYKNGIAGTAGSGGNAIAGGIKVSGGDVVVDGIGVKAHGHIENDAGGRTSDAVQ